MINSTFNVIFYATIFITFFIMCFGTNLLANLSCRIFLVRLTLQRVAYAPRIQRQEREVLTATILIILAAFLVLRQTDKKPRTYLS